MKMLMGFAVLAMGVNGFAATNFAFSGKTACPPPAVAPAKPAQNASLNVILAKSSTTECPTTPVAPPVPPQND